jgi:signal transduction histidine kinase
MLVQGSEFITGTAMAGTAVYLTVTQNYPFPLAGILTNLFLAVIIAWLTIRALYTALDWLSKTQRRAEQLLDVTRSQQAELRSAVKSLQITNEARLQAERELLIANKQARESQRMKEQFAANISHEFRTPLSIILGFSEVMYLSPEVYGSLAWPPKLYRDVSQIYRNSRHLMSMIDDILDLSHFEMTGFTLNKEPTDLEPLLHESLSMVADLFRNDAVTLTAEIEPDLPLLELDRTRMRQVFLNLLNNACRFTEAGTVCLRAFRLDGEVRIQVTDTGPRHPPGAAGPHLYRVLPGGLFAQPQAWRRGAGAGHLPPLCAGARRPYLGRQHPGRRLHLYHRPAHRGAVARWPALPHPRPGGHAQRQAAACPDG